MSNGPESSPAPPTLDYCKRPALASVSRHRRKLILFALLLAAAIPIWRYWQPLKHRVLWLYWSHQATKYRMPEKSIDLFIDDPNKAAAARSNNPDYVSGTLGAVGQQLATFQPVIYRNLLQYDSRLNLTGGADQAVVFMGVLKRPDGIPRMVIVSGYHGITGNLLVFTSVLVLPLPDWTDPLPPGISSRIGRSMNYSGPPATETRLRSGTVDPNDPSHFVFDFEAGQRGGFFSSLGGTTSPTQWTISATGIIDARLQNDDSIAFSLRSFTGTDANIRIGAANTTMIGDVQTLQTQSQQRAARLRGAAPPTTRAGRIGRSNG